MISNYIHCARFMIILNITSRKCLYYHLEIKESSLSPPTTLNLYSFKSNSETHFSRFPSATCMRQPHRCTGGIYCLLRWKSYLAMCIDCNMCIVLCTILGTLLWQHVHRFFAHVYTCMGSHSHATTNSDKQSFKPCYHHQILVLFYICQTSHNNVLRVAAPLPLPLPLPKSLQCNFIQFLDRSPGKFIS